MDRTRKSMRTLLGLALGLHLTLAAAAEPATFHRLDGRPVNLAQLCKSSPTGVVLLVCWCSECPSCRRVEGQVEKLTREYHDRARVFAVDVHASDTPDQVKKFLTASKLGLDIVIDETLVDKYKIERTTTALLFDSQGRLRYQGPFSTKDKECAHLALEQLLRGDPVSPEKLPQNGCSFIPRGQKRPMSPQCDMP